MQRDDDCVVCFESIGDNRVQNSNLFPCGHADKIDQSCLQGIIQANAKPTCPWCRQPLSFNHCTNPFNRPAVTEGSYMEASVLDMPSASAVVPTEESPRMSPWVTGIIATSHVVVIVYLMFR